MVLLDRGGNGNKQKEAAPGYKLQKEMRNQFPQKAKSEISNLVEKNKTKQNRSKNRKASETIIDTNDRER